jgi:hypothetical protein
MKVVLTQDVIATRIKFLPDGTTKETLIEAIELMAMTPTSVLSKVEVRMYGD